MVFNTTFNIHSAISWWSILLVDETGVPGKNHRPVASYWQNGELAKSIWATLAGLVPFQIDHHDIAEWMLKVVLNTINLSQFLYQHTITCVYKYLKLHSVTLRKQFHILQVFCNN
jgi:hypothetical protein